MRAARASPTARTGELPNGARYEFHGVGCRYSSSTFVVDFDFGPDGRTDGFDAWRLALFAETQGAEFSQSLAEIDSDLHQLMKEGAVIAPRLSPSEHLLYLAREKPSGVEGRTVSQK
ncbi:hypothetical protein AKJ09_09370 [Labilithrix luteola]|uniref:DUF6896 domain-containing protein n=1 Tax=Labilithrix luteola TaxID=1391654 RepID=A0A0K1QAM5_9BACT|nr:hypothetical protein AKJ09_09370 [Labilithrix luteola]